MAKETMQTFGFYQKETQSPRYTKIISPYGLFFAFCWCFIFLLVFVWIRLSSLKSLYTRWEIWSLLEKKSLYTSVIWWFDVASRRGTFSLFSTLLDLWWIYLWNSYQWSDWTLLTSLRLWLEKNESNIYAYLPDKYHTQFWLFMELLHYNEDLVSLLWFNWSQTYLVVLQNTSERRPNGWFFWSFGVVKVVDWKIADMEVRDSYILDYEPDEAGTIEWKRGDSDDEYLSIQWPERITWYLPSREIHFVWANKIWFTYHDWAHIKELYEKKYPHEVIRGVAFLRTDMFEELIPWFDETLQERQFTNAATDLIRGEGLFGKKEIYQKWVMDLVTQNKRLLIESLLEKLPYILEKRLLNVYMTNITVSWWLVWWWFKWWLQKNMLTTRFEKDNMYIRWSNTSFNKIDRFVSGSVQIKDSWWVVIQAFDDTWVLPFEQLDPGFYDIDVSYSLNVPYEYHSLIHSFEQKYDILLWDREKHILWLTHIWQNRGVSYLPDDIEILEITGDTELSWIFATPFEAHGAWYVMNIKENWWSMTVTLKVRKN